MVFLDRPMHRFRRDERSKKRPGATRGLDAVRLDTHQNLHAPSPELCTRHAGIQQGQKLQTFAWKYF